MDALHQRKIIENYSFGLSNKIGKGFSSTVFKGKNDLTGEQVAIKVIEMKLLEEDDIYKALLRTELDALKALAGHQYVLHLYDTFSTKNNTYLMTELCDTDLSKVIKDKKTFHLAEALTLITQILDGYMAIHKAGFVHRDLKPANIFLVSGQCKIADFGFAVPTAEMHNHTNYNVGSPLYMAPEALKENKYSFSSDIWAIAVILFEILKGFPPWRARSEQTLYSKLVNEPIDNQIYDLPTQCKDFIHRALKIQITERLSPEEVSNWIANFKKIASSVRPMTAAPATHRENQLMPSNSIRMEIPHGIMIPTNSVQPPSVNQPVLKEINMNSIGVTSKMPRDSSIPIQFSCKTRETSRSPMKQMKNRFTAITPKNTKENVMTFEEIQYRPSTVAASQQSFIPTPSSNSLSTPLPQGNTFLSVLSPPQSEPVAASVPNTEALVVSYLNFCKFIYKLLQILSSPLKFCFPSSTLIQTILTNFLNGKIKKLWELFDKGINSSLSFQGWSQFSQSASFRTIKAKVQKVYRKYTIMFPSVNQQFIFNPETTIQKGVHELLDYLSSNFDQKSVILMDYLTTAYQLLDLDKKHDANKFPGVSRIDIIVQGSPFNVTQEHLGKLINKIAIIGI